MKHLVTGARGFLGTHLMRALGDDAIGVDLPECDVTRVARSGMPEIYRAFPQSERIETVWHLAAINDATASFYERPYAVLETQIRGTLNVIDACVANGVKTLFLFSSSEVYQNAPIPTPEDIPITVPDLKNPRYSYGGGKIAAELLAWWSAIPKVFVIRPHNVWGEGQREGHAIPDLRKRIREAPDGSTVIVRGHHDHVRSYCHVDDFIAGCLAILKHHESDERAREVYNVGNPENRMTNERLFDWLIHDECRPDLKAAYQLPPMGSVAERVPDVSKLRAIGWEANVKL